MFSRLTGATMRAALVATLVATPFLVIPVEGAGMTQVVVFVALVAAAFTFVEYAATAPSLLEFRAAPPFNRLRFAALLVILAALLALQQGQAEGSTLSRLVAALGIRAGEAIDIPFSPVRLILLTLPADTAPGAVANLRHAAGVSYLLSLLMVAAFWLCIRLTGWPARAGSFNIWINMPTFDPMAGRDLAFRLRRDAQVNLMLGFLLPFLVPLLVRFAWAGAGPAVLTDPHILIWTMTAWAFFPATLLMRGLALARIARLVAAQRARAAQPGRSLQPA